MSQEPIGIRELSAVEVELLRLVEREALVEHLIEGGECGHELHNDGSGRLIREERPLEQPLIGEQRGVDAEPDAFALALQTAHTRTSTRTYPIPNSHIWHSTRTRRVRVRIFDFETSSLCVAVTWRDARGNTAGGAPSRPRRPRTTAGRE